MRKLCVPWPILRLAGAELYEYEAFVESVVDADTVDLLVDLGLEVQRAIRVRLLGIAAPELHIDAGKRAVARVEALLPIGDKVIVNTFKDRTEKYGRYLATIKFGFGRARPRHAARQ